MDNKLHVLKSGKTEEVLPEPVEVVARPKFNWKIRILLPGLVFGGFLVLLGLSAYSEFVPAVTVHASPVISKKVAGGVAGAVTVQAAGWVEADPYKSYVTALTDGVIQEVLVFEGDIVQKGQVVATLIDEDARLAAQRSTDKVKNWRPFWLRTRLSLKQPRPNGRTQSNASGLSTWPLLNWLKRKLFWNRSRLKLPWRSPIWKMPRANTIERQDCSIQKPFRNRNISGFVLSIMLRSPRSPLSK